MGSTNDIQEYEIFLIEKELVESTRKLYIRKAIKLIEFLDGRQITKELIVVYKGELSKKKYAVTTLNLNIVAVNSYLCFVGLQEYKIKTKRIQKRRSLGNVLSIEEYQILLSYAKESGREKYYFIMRTLALTGIRISELSYFSVECLEQGVIMVNNKEKTREIFLPDDLIKDLRRYCRLNEIQKGVIFKGNQQRPISRISVYKMLQKLATMTGISKEKVHPHNFRHLFAVTYMRHYSNVFELADILGHSSLETTRIYTMATAEEKRQRMNELGL